MKIIPVDFETHGIENRPDYPPVPVGVATKLGGKNVYLAWGHPSGNNCIKSEAIKILRDIFSNHVPVFHNAAFDLAVALKHMGQKMPKHGFHDTLFLAYLNDPRDPSLSLKPLSEKYLGLKPMEQTKLLAWIEENVFEPRGWKVTKSNPLAKYIALAPGDLVAPYAIGDIVRTEKLFKYFKHLVDTPAYLREKQVLPIFELMSDRGLMTDTQALKRDCKKWVKSQKEVEISIRKSLKSPDLNIDSNTELADAMEATDKVSHWIYTDKGNRSTSSDNLKLVCTDQALKDDLALYSKLGTFINTFALPWIESGEKNNGLIYPTYNQVRSPDEFGGMRGGTRTGRPSSSNPNLFNVPSDPYDEDKEWTKLLPALRKYIVPRPGNCFINRDYSQQEVRILAHYEGGSLSRAFQENPKLDVHVLVQQKIREITGIALERRPVKVLNFGMIYGMGAKGTAEKLGIYIEEAKVLIAAHKKALPGVADLSNTLKKIVNRGEPISTWGGREYYVEEYKIVGNQKRTFEYKMLNYLVQGSAADVTKQAMIQVDFACDSSIILQVYDEIMCEVPIEDVHRYMRRMQQGMESIDISIPMLTDGKWSAKSWGHCKPYKDK